MIYVACGYSGTGSSAIVHLLSEYDNCTTENLNKFEHVLFYTPNGLFDLEDRLLINNHIHMSDGAINLFENAMMNLNENNYYWFGGYKYRYGDIFLNNVHAFIDDLTQFKSEGDWSYDYYTKITFKGIIKDFFKIILNKKINNKFGHRVIRKNDNIIRYSFLTNGEFYNVSKKFINRYIDMIWKDKSKNLILDQLLLPHNMKRIDNYFDDNFKFIVVDRDPRDIYILSKYVWPNMGFKKCFPDNPEEFVNFYKKLKEVEKIVDNKNILRIHFEDMIYKYDETVEKIENFLGLDKKNHINKKVIFNPVVSIKNTQNFKIKDEWEKEVKYIENELKEMIYDFPYEIKPNLEETSDP